MKEILMSKENQATIYGDKNVYLGRGGGVSNRAGNTSFREICHSNYENYRGSKKVQKSKLSKKLLNDFIKDGFNFFDMDGRQMNPSNNKDDSSCILNKISQTIRDKDCSLRIKKQTSSVSAEGAIVRTTTSKFAFDKLDLDIEEVYSCLDKEKQSDFRDTKKQHVSEESPTFVQRVGGGKPEAYTQRLKSTYLRPTNPRTEEPATLAQRVGGGKPEAYTQRLQSANIRPANPRASVSPNTNSPIGRS